MRRPWVDLRDRRHACQRRRERVVRRARERARVRADFDRPADRAPRRDAVAPLRFVERRLRELLVDLLLERERPPDDVLLRARPALRPPLRIGSWFSGLP